MISEEFAKYKHCDESCEFTNPDTLTCEKLNMKILPYQKCILELERETILVVSKENIPEETKND